MFSRRQPKSFHWILLSFMLAYDSLSYQATANHIMMLSVSISVCLFHFAEFTPAFFIPHLFRTRQQHDMDSLVSPRSLVPTSNKPQCPDTDAALYTSERMGTYQIQCGRSYTSLLSSTLSSSSGTLAICIALCDTHNTAEPEMSRLDQAPSPTGNYCTGITFDHNAGTCFLITEPNSVEAREYVVGRDSAVLLSNPIDTYLQPSTEIAGQQEESLSRQDLYSDAQLPLPVVTVTIYSTAFVPAEIATM